MGLDNGVIRIKRELLPLEYSQINIYGIDHDEICYWRKCWDFRNTIVSDIYNDKESEFHYYEITEDNIDNFIDILTHNIIEATDDIYNDWDDWGNPDWNKINLANLLIIKEDIISPKSKYKYFFYDSY